MIENSEKWAFLVNPNAGSKKCSRDWNQIKNIIDAYKQDCVFHFTEKKLHAIEISMQLAKQGYRKFVAVGGDGTLNEVANGIFYSGVFTKDDFLLGIVPVGTGNDWCRMYSIPVDYREAVEIIFHGKPFLQDLGVIEYSENDTKSTRCFVNVTGIGFDGAVAVKTNQVKERGKGSKLSYMLNIFSSLMSFKSFPAVIKIDEQEFKENLFSMNVGICKYNGGGMMQVPFAISDDGLLDITVIRKITKGKVVFNVGKLYDGSFTKLPEVSVFKAKKVFVASEFPVPIEVDGESIGFSPATFSIEHKAIQMITGKK